MTLQGIIDESVTGKGADQVGDRIELCKETIELTETLDVARGVHGMRLVGRGRATRFRWRGPAEGPVFRFTDANGCELADVMVELDEPADVLVQTLDTGKGAVRSSHNVLRNIYVPDAGDKLGTFWRIGGGLDQKNDFMRGYDLDVSECRTGVAVEGRNSLNNELYGCVFKGRAAGRVGLRTVTGGSLRMFGGGLVQFAESAFDVDTRAGVALAAIGVHVEKCARLITGPEQDDGMTTHVAILDGLRWGSNVDEIPADGEIIQFSGGTLIVRGCWFGAGTPNQTVYRFRYTTPQPFGDFVLEDSRVRAASKVGLFPGLPPTSVRGTLIHVGATGAPEPIPSSSAGQDSAKVKPVRRTPLDRRVLASIRPYRMSPADRGRRSMEDPASMRVGWARQFESSWVRSVRVPMGRAIQPSVRAAAACSTLGVLARPSAAARALSAAMTASSA